jgi:hypothetical protein
VGKPFVVRYYVDGKKKVMKKQRRGKGKGLTDKVILYGARQL